MKQEYSLQLISKEDASKLLIPFHYLTKISRGFKSGKNFGLFHDGELVGVCIFTGFPVPELVVGIFGLSRSEQAGFWELSRLCLSPTVQKTEYNLASWFVSRAIKELRKIEKVRAILSYADAAYHKGTIYRACNFGYYGLSAPKNDFWSELPDGSLKKESRGGSIKSCKGKWIPRTQKHRYLLIFDKSLTCRWNKQ